jgi:hypothetical protein
MSQESIDEILIRFDRLSQEERSRLLAMLEHRQADPANGVSSTMSLLEAFQKHGLVGSIKDAPADWSTNPLYSVDFGKPSNAP